MTLIPDLERELVEAAGRVRSVRRRARRAAVLGVAAAAAAAVALVTFWSSDEDPGPKRAAGDQPQSTPAPPRYNRPAPGTLVKLSTFGFRGVRYELSGYPSRDGGVCLQIRQSPPVTGATDERPSVTCAGGRHLRSRLREERVLNVGGGGGGERLEVTGFTIAGVFRIKVTGTDLPSHVELTRPWHPWDGPRIRAFLIVVDPPRGADISSPAFRIRAVEAGR